MIAASIGAVALAVLVLLVQPVAAIEPGNAARGERAFQRCYSCHSVNPKEAANLQGPHLQGIVGRPAGAVAGFDYSDALLARARSGLVWDEQTLDAFIADAETFLPGTRMGLPPLAEVQERADVVAYLKAVGWGEVGLSPSSHPAHQIPPVSFCGRLCRGRR